MLNPFSVPATPHRVEAGGRSWFANCAWDALGIPAALHRDGAVHSECADCGEPLELEVRDGRLVRGAELLVHFSSPPGAGGTTSSSPEARWSSSGRRSTGTAGSRPNGWEPGATLTAEHERARAPLVVDAAGAELAAPHLEDSQAVLEGLGLTGDFWRLA